MYIHVGENVIIDEPFSSPVKKSYKQSEVPDNCIQCNALKGFSKIFFKQLVTKFEIKRDSNQSLIFIITRDGNHSLNFITTSREHSLVSIKKNGLRFQMKKALVARRIINIPSGYYQACWSFRNFLREKEMVKT